MKEDNGTFGIIVGGLVALAAVIFIFGGGELGGKTVIKATKTCRRSRRPIGKLALAG